MGELIMQTKRTSAARKPSKGETRRFAKPVVNCDYCQRPARLVGGNVIYPHRPDLESKKFWLCAFCDAYVGCHSGTIKPLGRLANAELRKAKVAAHDAFDPIWKARLAEKQKLDPAYQQHHARGGRYKRLAELMGLRAQDCHIGMFTPEQCYQAIAICKSGALA